MSLEMPNNVEKKSEQFPTREGIISELDKIIKGPYQIGRDLKDAKGCTVIEAFVIDEKTKEKAEHLYLREGNHGTDSSAVTSIIVSYADLTAQGKYEASFAKPIAEYREGKWVYL
ncbi:MAG: hypothetical protein Greene101420_676 [Parcubacteria group bacterium Greene1014_20]|nr:MAG: hypothetical protein Greene041636_666 [Parcubacteria group bacterium Greene0416_36]TSC98624.1 MAG: hypothetical protein Greene101420_676 [Parcubacteria group bacterium Greene1014_20]